MNAARGTSRLRRLRRRGFTLVEVVAVLVIMGIMLLLALPDVESSSRTYRLQSGANKVMAALLFAQAASINTGVDHGCEFSTVANTVRCFQVVGSPPYPTVNHPVKKTPYLVDFDTEPGLGGVALSSVTFPSSTVTFDSLGGPDNGGTATVSIGAYSKNVDVSAIVGLMEFSDP